jgi:Ni/Co efflux regulator RcnB
LGDFLPGIFFSTQYWLNDWDAYGLYPPPPGTRWVRYGPDALLIDRYSGEIIRVEYNAFY